MEEIPCTTKAEIAVLSGIRVLGEELKETLPLISAVATRNLGQFTRTDTPELADLANTARDAHSALRSLTVVAEALGFLPSVIDSVAGGFSKPVAAGKQATDD